MCTQINQQTKCRCWHKSGWNETLKREIRLSNQRKRRKKQEKNQTCEFHCKKLKRQPVEPSNLRSAHITLSSFTRMVMFLSFSIVILPMIISLISHKNVKLANCQLILDHPKSRSHRATPERNSLIFPATLAPYSLPIVDRSYNAYDTDKDRNLGQQSSLHPWKLSEYYASENIANYSTLPTNQDKQNELLRKLSSTMLLETLIRHPFPINKAPFPPLPWPSTASDRRAITANNYLDSSNNDNHRPKGLRKSTNKQIRLKPIGLRRGTIEDRGAVMDVSTTNRSTISTKREPNNTNSEYNPLISQELFNSSSLNYLVDQLLSVRPFKQDNTVQLKRPPSNRQKPSFNSNSTYPEPYGHRKHPIAADVNSTNPEVTLDMLIRDEYDSRVKPMLKSLMDQQKLSSTTSLKDEGSLIDTVGPINHKIDELASGSDTTTTNFGSGGENQTIKKNIQNLNAIVPTTTPMSSETIATIDPEDHNTLVTFEDTEDGEEGEDDDDDTNLSESDLDLDKILSLKDGGKISKSVTIKPESKKTLQNVPPYQLSGTFEMHPVRTRPPKLNLAIPAPQATTVRPIASTENPKFRSTTARSVGKFGEKTADASVRGSLVFSDGATEAERANRRLAQSRRTTSVRPIVNSDLRNLSSRRKNQDLAPTTISDRTLHNQDDKPGESFLLNQLFSTMNPLADLDYKLKEQLNKKDSSTRSNNNPLVYKGYVGRDDHFISTAAKDWSRPIVGIRENAPTTMYKLQDTTIPLTTPAPPTDPPSVPYNYFLNQPVTNAQSVPSMVIPTSDPPEVTTQLPTTNTEYDRRKVSRQQIQNELSHTIQNITLSPMNNTTSVNLERKFSYQIPDKQPAANQSSIPVHSTQILGESELVGKSRNESASNSKLANEFDQNWSPSKVVQNESARPFQKRRQQAPGLDNQTSTVVNSMSPLSPMLVPIVGPKTPTGTLNRSQSKVLGDNDSDTSGLTTTAKPSQGTMISESDSHEDGSIQKNSSHTDHGSKSNKRNRVKILSSTNASSGLMGDTDGDHWTSSSETGGGVKKKNHKPMLININNHQKKSATKPDRSEMDSDDHDDGDEDSDESDEHEHFQQKPKINKVVRDRIRDDDLNGDDEKQNIKQNKTMKKSTYNENHELAGSEILVTGFDKNLRFPEAKRRNQTMSFSNSRQPSRVIETILIDGSEAGSVQGSSGSGSSSFGSTIIPNSNYFGDAPSESTILDNPTSINESSLNGKNSKHRTFTNEDPYQRSSNTVLSTVQQPSSTTSNPADVSKSQTTIAQVTTKQHEDVGSSSSSSSTTSTAQQPTKPVSKTSNDRLAFILIGGSCALSVVCLVLAAMSMRCQDMCDDYRSLRNAERAALKLQKHRLKYTKNHQINRLNHSGRISPDIGRNVIDDLNIQNNSSLESEFNHMRNSKCLNSKAIQFNDPFSKTTDAELNVWNSTKCQLPVAAYINKEPMACRCGNCINSRWLCQDEMVPRNKEQTWLQPYYYMQNHSRVRPLFGVGSSVGTFFPRRLDDHNFIAGGPSDAQILIDNQPSHSCVVNDPRDATRSKSILHTSKKSRHPDNLETHCEMPNFNCNNPEHSHHVCHNHHKYNMETSTSDESKMTLDESVHCDSTKCSANHQNAGLINRLKMMHVRSNGHKHQSTVWKPESIRKSSKNHHHHHHHHHSQPQMSSSEGSLIAAQCTCSRDHQPLLTKASSRQRHRTSHKHSSFKREPRISSQQQAKRDKAMLIWSTNRDRLI